MTQVFGRPDPFAQEQAQVDALKATEPVVRGISLGTGAPETLEEMGSALLETIRSSAVAKGVVLPSRQGVYMAPIPADCEQVVVLFTGWNPTPAGDTTGTVICKPWRWLAPMSAIITRCTPAIPGKTAKLSGQQQGALKLVTPDQLNAAAKIASDDAEVFLEVLNRMGEIGGDTSIVANPPQGGYQTVELNISLVSGSSFL